MKYIGLAKTSLQIIAIGFILFLVSFIIIFLLVILEQIRFIKGSYYYPEFFRLFIVYFLPIVIIFIIVISLLLSGSTLNTIKLLDTFSNTMLALLIYLTLFGILSMINIKGKPLVEVSIFPSYVALYIALTIIMIIAYTLKRKDVPNTTEEKVLHLISYVIKSAASTTVLLIILLSMSNLGLEIITNNIILTNILMVMLSIYILSIVWWSTIDVSFRIMLEVHHPVTLGNIFIKRLFIAFLSIIIASFSLCVVGNIIYILVSRTWDFSKIDEAAYIIIALATVFSLIGLIVGLVSAILFLASRHGLNGLSILAQLAKGEKIDLSAIGLELTSQSIQPATTSKPITTQQPTKLEKDRKLTMKCPYCNIDIPTGSKFCPNCGAYLLLDEGTSLYTERKEGS